MGGSVSIPMVQEARHRCKITFHNYIKIKHAACYCTIVGVDNERNELRFMMLNAAVRFRYCISQIQDLRASLLV